MHKITLQKLYNINKKMDKNLLNLKKSIILTLKIQNGILKMQNIYIVYHKARARIPCNCFREVPENDRYREYTVTEADR